MAKWDFKIVGASFVKELVPVGDDVNPRSQSFMQPSFDLEGDKIVMKESGQYKTAILFSQIGEIAGVAPTDIDDAYAKLLTLVENFNGGGGAPGTTPNLTQVLTQGDISSYTVPIPNNTFVTFDLGRELTENYFTTDDVGTGGVFLDKDIVFPENSTIRFQAGYVEDSVTPTDVTLLPYRFTTDAYVFYQGAIVTDITIQPEDVCTLKYAGYNSTDGIQIWFLTVVSKSSGGSGTVTNVSGTTNEITVSSPTTTPVVGISSNYTTARDAYADAKVEDNLTASTTVAPSKTAVNTALDLKQDKGNYWKLVAVDAGNTTHTGTLTETIVSSILIPANSLDALCDLFFSYDYGKGVNSTTIKVYLNTANNLTGATLFASYNAGSNRNGGFFRKMMLRGTSLDTQASTATLLTNWPGDLLFAATNVITLNPAVNNYILVTITLSNTGDVITTKRTILEKLNLIM